MNGKNLIKIAVALLFTLWGSQAPLKAQLIPPDPYFELDSWSFDDTNWLSDLGFAPVSFANLNNPPSFDGNCLQVDSTNAAWLQYNLVESDGTNEIDFNLGTIELWVLPDWISGTGPGTWGRLIDVGAYSTNTSSSWWSLYFTRDGSTINFSSETNGVFTNYLSVPIAWDTNTWHFLALTYDHAHSQLYVDGQLATNGAGVFYRPSAETVSNGFYVGGDSTGWAQSRAQIDDMATYNYILSADDIANDYTAGMQLMSPGGFHPADGSPISPGVGGGETNTDEFTNSYVSPNYGSNLWIAWPNITSNFFGGFASNTIADVEYEIQSLTNLADTNWVSQGFFLGSETTNFTPLNALAASKTNNFFIRLRSWADSDGIGIPDWWQLEYFGYIGIDPNGDPMGDGWSNAQKYQNGMNPNVFYTPPVPQGLAANLNPSGTTGSVSWLSSPGSVTGYTLEKTDSYSYPPVVQDFTLSASATNYSDNLSGDTPDTLFGNDYDVSYRLMASYTNGNSSPWTASVPLQQPTVTGDITPGTNGTTYLAISGVPANATTIRLLFVDWSNITFNDDTSGDYYEDIAVSAFTNGVYMLPASWQPPATDDNGDATYWMEVESVTANGVASAETYINGYGLPFVGDYNWGVPFYDGRAQMKQNLIFQLRFASASDSAHYYIEPGPNEYNNFGAVPGLYSYPANYAFAGLYQELNPHAVSILNSGGLLDPFLPYEENYLFRNFVFDPNGGSLNTGGGVNPGDPGYISMSSTPAYQFQVDLTNSPALLATNETQWLLYDDATNGQSWYNVLIDDVIDPYSGQSISLTMTNDVLNWFGLPYLSAEIPSQSLTDGSLVTNVINAGETIYPANYDFEGYVYPQPAQPQFSTVEYDFWNAYVQPGPGYSLEYSVLPGNSSFSPTNQSQLLLTSVGNNLFQVAGYAKLKVINSAYSGVYGYLGQYFDHAYAIDTNGNVTANTTGVLSPYGSFFATQPGPVALVTMPDLDTGERGTCTVYVVSLQLDANHDGIMDLIFGRTDATSLYSPFVFWINDNYDRTNYSSDDGGIVEEDLDQLQIEKLPAAQNVPDCNFVNASGQRVIPCTRDLEDFARLWAGGVTPGLLAALPTNSTITLSWSGATGNPTIDFFAAADPGIGYQTNETVAAQQIDPAQCPYLGRLSPTNSLLFTKNTWPTNQFIWCGVAAGNGELTMTIADGNSNVLAQTGVYIQIQDITQLYERWTIGDQLTNAPLTTASIATDFLPTNQPRFQYPLPVNSTPPYVLLVHGWNMTAWDKDRFAETAFKRLYWQGYQGRFGVFRWPTGNGISSLVSALENTRNYDNSENTAWQSSVGLTNLLAQLNAEYPSNLYLMAHSMGNVVAGEALRRAGSQLVNTYIAMQGAIPAHCYDSTTPDYTTYTPPDDYANYWTSGAPCYFSASAGAGGYINFYNTNDFALGWWLFNQSKKPDESILNYPGYYYSSSSGFYKILGPATNQTIYLNFPTNTYEIFAYGDPAWSYALGAQPNVNGVFKGAQINLPSIWPTDPYSRHNYSTHFWHSAEFRGDYPMQVNFWGTVIGARGFNLK